MRFPLRSAVLSCVCLLLTCAPNDAPEARRAELVLQRAREALSRGDHLGSRRHLTELLLLETTLGRPARRAEAALLLADNYIASAEFDSALLLCELAKTLYKESADRNGIRAAVLAQAHAHEVCGEDHKAYNLLADEMRIAKGLRLSEGVQEIKWKLLPLARTIGHVQAERELLDELHRDAVADADTASLARVSLTIGMMYKQQVVLDSAFEHVARSVWLAERARDPLLITEGLMQCGIIADLMNKRMEAYAYFSRALRTTDTVDRADRFRAELLLRAANMYMREGRFAGAKKFLNAALQSAIRSGNKVLETYALLHLGRCYTASPNEARKRYEAGAALAAHVGAPRVNAYAQWCLGDDALKHKRFDAALDHLRAAVASDDSALAYRDNYDILADCERTLFASRSPSDALVELLLKIGKPDEAFLVSERQNRMHLHRVLAGGDISTKDDELNAAMQSFFAARRNYVGAERQLLAAFSHSADSRARTANLQRSLMLHSARVRDISDSIATFHKRFRAALIPDHVVLEEIQQTIPPGTALVHYFPSSHALYAFVLTREDFSVDRAAVGRESLISSMTRFHNLLSSLAVDVEPAQAASLQRSANAISFQLYEAFFHPIRRLLGTKTRLYVVPSVRLPLVPLHALKPFGRSAGYVIERQQIRYASDAGVLALPGALLRRPPVVVAFGNQGRSVTDVFYEVSDIRAFAKGIQLLVNENLAALAQHRGDLLHCAVDLQFNTDRPENSFLAIRSGTEPVKMEYVSIGKLFLIAPFATTVISVLNNSAFDRSIPRICRMNGASDVIGTFYVPSRKAKKKFYELFYTRVMKGTAPENAVRESVLEMLKLEEYRPPHVWATFGLW